MLLAEGHVAEKLAQVRKYRAEDAECAPAEKILAGLSDEELLKDTNLHLTPEEICSWRLAVALEAVEELERDGRAGRVLRKMVAGLLG